jgi:signal transduction histidine kinase
MLHDLKRLQVMVSNILETSRIEEGRMALAPERVTLAEEAESTVEECQVAATDHGVRVECDIAEGLAVNADPVAVRTVLRNLVDNAVKAAGAAGGGKVVIGAAARDGFVDVTVSDNGIGSDSTSCEASLSSAGARSQRTARALARERR